MPGQQSPRRSLSPSPQGFTSKLVNTPPHWKPLHLTHSSMEINLQNFAGYFSDFSTLINVREGMTSETTSSRSNSSHPGRLSRPTYRQMGRSCPEKGAERPKSAPKLNVLTTLSLNSNRNSNLHDPLRTMSLFIRTLRNLFFQTTCNRKVAFHSPRRIFFGAGRPDKSSPASLRALGNPPPVLLKTHLGTFMSLSVSASLVPSPYVPSPYVPLSLVPMSLCLDRENS